jgi:hypothetical protein
LSPSARSSALRSGSEVEPTTLAEPAVVEEVKERAAAEQGTKKYGVRGLLGVDALPSKT